MTFIDFLQLQLGGSFKLLRGVAHDASRHEWAGVIAPGLNPVGFTIWHCARTIDFTINCAIRGQREVADLPAWRERLAPDAWFGYEVSTDAAATVAERVSSETVFAYLDELEPLVLGWLEGATEGQLEAVPDVDRTYRATGRYLNAPWFEQALDEDRGTPTWQFISGPCGGHVRIHVGEARALLQVWRSLKSA